MSAWNDPELLDLFLKRTPLIDVRAPIEFQAGHVPNSVNLPLINTEERHLIGTCYKQQGQAAAIELGHRLVSGKIKDERIEAWSSYINKEPEAQVFCFRGGLRSQISCEWISSAGHERKPIHGGYKRMRQFFLSYLNEAPLSKITRLGGFTGTGKTKLLQTIPHHIDLEGLANHRGSAFGVMGEQPSQVAFENALSFELMRNPHHVILEDESSRLGSLSIPPRLYQSMIEAPLIVLEIPVEERVKNIFDDYVKMNDAAFFTAGVERIARLLGKSRSLSLKSEIVSAFERGRDLDHHTKWITALLEEYYDPFYRRSLSKQNQLITFQGTSEEVMKRLQER
jgi:tRNA 2-selenouridine synthase